VTDPAKASVAPAKHYPLLDFLRASSAFLVLLGHTRNWIFTNIGAVDHPTVLLKFFWLVTVLEHEAVVIFFVLSGFLVGGALSRAIERGSFDLRNYLIARFARIYIVYVPALVLTGLTFWVGTHTLGDFGPESIRPLFSESQPDFGGVRSILCHAAGLQGFACEPWKENPALWSLGYEWLLYLVAPAILGLVLLRASLGMRLLAILLILCGVAAISIDLTDWIFWFSMWFLGVAAAYVARTISLPAWLGLIGVTALVGGMAVSRLRMVAIPETDIVIGLGTTLAISCRPLLYFPIAPRFFSWAAGFSYSLYATHIPLVFITIAVLQNLQFPPQKMLPSPLAFLAFGICTIVPLVLAYFFSLVTERRTDDFRAWIKSKVHKKDHPGAPVVEFQVDRGVKHHIPAAIRTSAQHAESGE
jgi:peptidoglycan/LPS O-acetylase OafA/YrhL